MLNQVPSATAPHIVAFCESINPSTTAVVVPSSPPPSAAQLDCFITVADQVAQQGGQSIIGWAIWEVPGAFVEAEFHAVWQKPDGEYLDLTPRSTPFPQILFLPDPMRTYEGKQVDNVRKALVKDQLVIRFLFLQSQRFALLNRGALADQHGLVELTPRAAKEYHAIEKELELVGRRLSKRLDRTAISNSATR